MKNEIKKLKSLLSGKRIALFFSGASTKIGMLVGAGVMLLRTFGIRVVVIVGTSSGAMCALILAIGLYQTAKNKARTFTIKDIFRENPNSLRGMLKAVNRVLHGHYNLYDQTKLVETLKGLISEESFYAWANSINSPDVMIGIYNAETRARHYVSLKSKSYEEALDIVLASTSIPIASAPVNINGQMYYDGGVRDHIGSEWYVSNYHGKIDECISVYSRPEVFTGDDREISKPFTFEPPTKFPKLKNIKRILGLGLELYDVMLNEISKSDEVKTDLLCDKYRIKHTKIFAPYKLADGVYETSPEMNDRLLSIGEEQAVQWMNDRLK